MIFFSWFAVRRPLPDCRELLLSRIERFAAARTNPEWTRVLRYGPGWGVFAAAPAAGGWQWELLADDDELTVVSTAPPVGLEPDVVTAGPAALGRAALRGGGIGAGVGGSGVVPPFGLLALDQAAGRFSLTQDWLGMARMFEYSSQGLVTFSSSPVMPPYVLGDRLVPDEDGWSRYLGGGIFGGSSTPVRGVRGLPAGAVRAGRRLDDGTWRTGLTHGERIDDLLTGPATSAAQSLAATASGLRRAGAGLAALWPGEVRLGLSGGKDSRLVAAALVSAGLRPRLFTRDDNPAETTTATELVGRVRDARGLELPHDIVPTVTKAQVSVESLAARARQLLQRYEFGYGSSYLLRPAVGLAWPAALAAPTVGGAMGEIATARWIPHSWPGQDGKVDGAALRSVLNHVLASEIQPEWQTGDTRRRLAIAVEEVVERGARLGLDAVGTVHLTYLAERMRVWSSAGFHVNQVAPLLTAEFVRSAFAMTLEEKRARAIHTGLIDSLVPEWAGVPFIPNTAGLAPSAIPRIWDGDGVEVLAEMVARPPGPLLDLFDRVSIEDAFDRVRAGDGTGKDDAALRNVVVLATAEDLFDELNAEVRALVQVPRPLPVPSRSRYRQARRRAAQVLPQPILGAALQARDLARGRRTPADGGSVAG
ncbi:hypothetical protein [Jiangella asiatica]|uniref:Asparagine synthetase domain-containing protein n=1 Tax=Jiangella asiatica TaxID=2530372 RepID=A0A4R5DX51_9ACTN|nr:hypothetical protein [Jiangella asiatica]TDE15895.1 hypothetical protein E1269_00965 [Jiangella asiatica]